MRLFQQAAFALSRYAAYAAGAILCLMVLHILVEIVLRTFFATSTFMLDEMVGYGVAAMTFLALGYTFEFGGIIRVNLLLNRFAETGLVRRVIELACILATLFATGVAIWFFFRTVRRAYVRGYVSETLAQIPAWIPEGLMMLGLAIFWLQLFAYFLRIATGESPQGSEHSANLGME